MNILRDIKGTVQPFWVTLRNMFRKPVTIQYPEEKRQPPPRYRARIILARDPDGGERCVACYLCSAACPVDCIYGRDDPDAEMLLIHPEQCIDCGLCIDACPVLAIFPASEVPARWRS